MYCSQVVDASHPTHLIERLKWMDIAQLFHTIDVLTVILSSSFTHTHVYTRHIKRRKVANIVNMLELLVVI